MINPKNMIAAALLALTMGAAAPAAAAEAVAVERQNWSFSGVFGTFDEHQLQRGFQVFKDVCASCHSANLLAFRNLAEHGGPGFSEDQVKALAATFEIADPSVEGGTRPGVPADRWPAPFASDAEAREANGGSLPPDLSVIAKARTIPTPFPWWILNYIPGYSEGGPDYIYALLTGYHDEVPAGTVNADGTPFELPEGKFFNSVFPGHAIGMGPPLSDGSVTYDDPNFPATLSQHAHDVSAFLMWVAEPGLVGRKEAGFRVILFLVVFAAMMWLVKRRIWAPVHRHEGHETRA